MIKHKTRFLLLFISVILVSGLFIPNTLRVEAAYPVCRVKKCTRANIHRHHRRIYRAHTFNDGHFYHKRICRVRNCKKTQVHRHKGIFYKARNLKDRRSYRHNSDRSHSNYRGGGYHRGGHH